MSNDTGIMQRKSKMQTVAGAASMITLQESNVDSSGSSLQSTSNNKKQQEWQQKRVWTWVILLEFFLLGGLIYVDEISHLDFGTGILGTSGPNPNSISRTNLAAEDDPNSNRKSDNTLTMDKEQSSPYLNNSYRNKEDGKMYHLIFSTDCSGFQHWQSYLMFHSAYKVSQPGTITRIASGCSNEEAERALQWHKEHVTDVFGPRFILFLTPHFSGVKDKDGNIVGDYKFFNKPFGLKYWLQNAIPTQNQLEEDENKTPLLNENDVVILIDPDMLLLRPITGDFSNDRDVVIGSRNAKHRKFQVEHGSPFAQKYGMGTQWRTFNLKEITQDERSPAMEVSQQDGGTFYPVGPPYLGTVRDMYQIALKWSDFAPRVHAEYPYLLAEMYAYCIAAAHLKLPHMLIDSMMVSNTGAGGEGWPMVDAMETKGLCAFAKHPDHSQQPVPSLIHYCQRYALGSWFFSKRKMVTNFFDCKSPYMEEPPDTLVEETDWAIPFGGNRKTLNPTMAKREGFTVCALLSALNDASAFFKEHHCGSKANMEKTLNLNWKNNKAE